MLGGTEYQTLNLVKVLKESGYDVTVLCYFEYNATMIQYMKNAGANVLLMTENGRRPKKFSALLWVLFFGFKKALKQVKPNVVHVQYMAPGTLSILLFKLFGVKKIIATAHVPGHIYKRKWIPKLISKYVTKSFLCVSKSSEEAFFNETAALFSKDLFREGRKHFTIYNCIDTDVMMQYQIAKIENSYFTIGIVSRLSYEKGVDIIISALPKILKQKLNIKLLIVGDGAQKQNLLYLAEKLGIAEYIEWVGLQPRSALFNYYLQMDVVVIPSRFEGFGLTAIEAMTYGIPVVASNVDGLKEVIVDRVSGILFECENIDALTQTIIELVNNNDMKEKLKKEGRKRVEEKFSYTSYKDNIAELYGLLEEGEV